MPITIVRPFNNYGPGMKLQDKRVPADFAQAIMENQDITILSDGAPKRTFCYSADAVVGYLKASLLGRLETFNIGIESPEVSIRELATLYQEIGKAKFGYTGQVVYRSSEESNYLVDNPGRRCPCIDKARQLLGYAPQITARAGIERFLTFLWSSR
jgi:UDP-glucuronate decarboxylase